MEKKLVLYNTENDKYWTDMWEFRFSPYTKDAKRFDSEEEIIEYINSTAWIEELKFNTISFYEIRTILIIY
jgi:hypothetical protein